MNPIVSNLNKSSGEKKLLKLFKSLPDAERQTLLDFAEFLVARTEPQSVEIPAPELIPRPDEESVVKALKRLSASYHMLDKSKMLNETSTLMAQHVMQGRPAEEVINELEAVFETHYKRLIGEQE